MYTSQSLIVRWNASNSHCFQRHVAFGIKQVGMLSSISYYVYTNELLIALEKSGVGCFIGPYFYGALAYVDYIILLNPTVKRTKKLLQICEMYAKEHKILFNAQKVNIYIFILKKYQFLYKYVFFLK